MTDTLSGQSSDYPVADAIAYEPLNAPRNSATWNVPVVSAGEYKVWARWRAYSGRASNAPYTISHANGQTTVTANQEETSGAWRYLGTYEFNAGSAAIKLTDDADGLVIADAVALDPVSTSAAPLTWNPTLPAAGQYNVYARWSEGLDRAPDAKYTIAHDGGQTDIVVDQRESGDTWYALGTYSFTPGQSQGVELSNAAAGVVTGDAIVFEPVGATPNMATFTPVIATSDEYFVWARWRAYSGRATNAPYTIYHVGGQTTVTVNQTKNSGVWMLLGKFNMTSGQGHRVELADRLPDGANANGLVVADAVAIESTSSVGNLVSWMPTLPQADKYEVTASWPHKNSGATDAQYIVTHAGGTTSVLIDQSKPSARHPQQVNERVSLGVFDFVPGTGHKVELSDRASGALIADSMRWTPVLAPDRLASWQGTVTNGGDYRLMARWPSAPDLAANAKYTVTTPAGTSSVTLDQSQGGGTWHPLKTVTLAANDNWRVDLSDKAAGPVAADAVVAVPVAALDAFTWAPTLPSAGTYQVFAKWPSLNSLASDAVYKVTHEGGVAEIAVSQKQGGGSWRYLGNWDFDPAHSPNVKLQASLLGQVSADAVRFVKQSASGGVSYILSDQIGQPQKMADQAGTITWDRIASPFGETASMATGGSSDLGLRFPGQQDDAATGLAYNYFRDYDPSIGRYVQSDPIGLGGGLNTYAYVGGNPVSWVDPNGMWSSKAGFFVHQQSIHRQLYNPWTGLSLGDIAKLNDAQEYADGPDFQGPEDSYRHGMRSPSQTAEQACILADIFVRNQFALAWAAQAAGNRSQALHEFGVGLHTLQDSTSPSHRNFQQWSGQETFIEKFNHSFAESSYPNGAEDLDRITRQAWIWFRNGSLPIEGAFNCGCRTFE